MAHHATFHPATMTSPVVTASHYHRDPQAVTCLLLSRFAAVLFVLFGRLGFDALEHYAGQYPQRVV
jgi:hypothetical protein